MQRDRCAGLAATFSHTSSHQLATRGYAGAPWVDDVLRRWYRSDSLGRVTERGGPDSLFQAFAYDSAGRLRSWTKKALRTGVSCTNTDGYGYSCTGATPWVLSPAVTPTYDKVGNPTDSGAVTTAGNRLTTFNGVTMTYDADGFMRTRVTSTTTDTLTWDEFGRLASFKRVVSGQSPATTTFAYDGFGRRIRKTSAIVGTLEYLWDGDQIIAEVDGGGSRAVVQTYTYYPGIDQPRSVTTGGETYFMSTEPDGTINGLIRKSDREVVAQFTYTPWGELETASQSVNAAINRLRWKGLPYDPESGFYYMRARYYDPKIRRFVSEDPIGLEGGINIYAFASGDPINGNDPSGLDDKNNGHMPCWEENVAVEKLNYDGPRVKYCGVPYINFPTMYSLADYQGSGGGWAGPQTGPAGQATGGGSPGASQPSKFSSKACRGALGKAAVALVADGMVLVPWGVALRASAAAQAARVLGAEAAAKGFVQRGLYGGVSLSNRFRVAVGRSERIATVSRRVAMGALVTNAITNDAASDLLQGAWGEIRNIIPGVNFGYKAFAAYEACF